MEKEFEKAKNLLITRKYSELLDVVGKIEKQDKLDEEQKDKVQDYRMRALIRSGRVEEVYKKLDQEIKDYTLKKDWINVLDSIIWKVRAIVIEFKNKDMLISTIDEGLEIVKQISKMTPELLRRKAWLYYWKGNFFIFTDERKKAIKNFQLAVNIAEEISDLEIKGLSLQRLGVAYGGLSNLELSIKYLTKALEIYKKLEKTDIANLYQNLSITYALKGEYKKSRENAYKHTEILGREVPIIIIGIGDSYWREGELEKGLEYMEKGIERVREQLENPDEDQLILYNTANLLLRKGEIQKAQDKYKKCIEISTKYKVRDQPWFYFDIGLASCYLYKGELNEALEYAQEALEKCEKISNKYALGWVHYLLARIFYEKNESFTALVHAQSSLDYRQEIGNKQEMALTLRWIITLLLENQDYDEAINHFDQLKELAKNTDDMITDRCFRLTEAMMLKSKTRPKYWIQAIDILEELANDKIVDYELSVTGLVLLCELLLNEFSISGDEDVLQDLQTHTSRVVEIAKKQNIYSLRVEAHNIRILSFWIQAQYSKVDIDIQNARKLLKEAKELADEKGLVKLAQKIGNQHAQLLEQLHNWNEFIRKYYEFIKKLRE